MANITIPEITFTTEHIPEELKERKQWICWKYDIRDGKLVKLPLAPWTTGYDGAASATDPANMAGFQQAVDTARQNGWGIGFCFFSGDGISGIDLDKLDEEAQAIIDKADSYMERSPSGKGVHVLVKGKISEPIKKDKIEVYSEDRFFTVTGDRFENSPSELRDGQEVLDFLERKYGARTVVASSMKNVGSWDEYVNCKGWALREIREKDEKLNELLRGASFTADKPTASEADMSTLTKLLFWGYTEGEAVDILTYYRGRDKLKRRDYIQGMLSKIQVQEVVSKKRDNNKRESQADKILTLLGDDLLLFHDQHGTPYTQIKQDDVKVTLPVRSRRFKTWVANLLYTKQNKVPNTETLNAVLNVLHGQALFEGRKYTLYNRVAPAPDGIWIDMCDDRWRAIKVTGEGWKIVEDPPILFRRYSHQKPLATPEPGGDPFQLLEFLNIKDEDTNLVLLNAVVSSFIPNIPHVILVFYGIQGSGKTTAFKLLRSLIDPSAIEVLSIPWKERERVQQLDHHWCAYYDNISRLPRSMSDTLCRAATGGGFSKRELYTDDEDIIYNFKRCLGLSGINIAAQRGDLLDRSLLVGLKNIPSDQRKTEDELLSEFEDHKARILGGILDTLAKAIRLYPEVNTPRLFRMADFTRWGCAITLALGKEEEEFLDAYEEKVKSQIEEAALQNPVANVLMSWFKHEDEYEGEPTELYIALRNHAKVIGVSRRQKEWPKASNALTRQLNELTPSLEQLGIKVETGAKKRVGDKVKRVTRIIRKNVNTGNTDNKHNIQHSSRDGVDDVDDTSLTSYNG